ncbi:DUF4363 family protein [Natronincola ferrireducens]|uniref:DUF4363 family protein n=1 Tax=Natronincola ferrireducens TaxID=393762 RepID=A0A1G9H1R9_9FIRM|nr:DUF4363 family protein [Natronincola ferrireducens]SDL06819.1 protein of unknown function [Natronincola ferrireducens]
MKVVVITILILVVFFIASLYFTYYLNQSAETFIDMIEKLDKSITQENWEEAQEHIERVMKEWDKTKKIWLGFLEHYEIDMIDIILARTQKYVTIEERSLALGGVAELKLLVEHILDKQTLKLQNIL